MENEAGEGRKATLIFGREAVKLGSVRADFSEMSEALSSWGQLSRAEELHLSDYF